MGDACSLSVKPTKPARWERELPTQSAKQPAALVDEWRFDCNPPGELVGKVVVHHSIAKVP